MLLFLLVNIRMENLMELLELLIHLEISMKVYIMAIRKEMVLVDMYIEVEMDILVGFRMIK